MSGSAGKATSPGLYAFMQPAADEAQPRPVSKKKDPITDQVSFDVLLPNRRLARLFRQQFFADDFSTGT